MWTSNCGLTVNYGLLAITNGGAMTTASTASVGGTATVDGRGSTWTNNNGVTVGTLLGITNGGAVTTAGTALIDGTVTVDGSGSTWTNNWMSGTSGMRPMRLRGQRHPEDNQWRHRHEQCSRIRGYFTVLELRVGNGDG